MSQQTEVLIPDLTPEKIFIEKGRAAAILPEELLRKDLFPEDLPQNIRDRDFYNWIETQGKEARDYDVALEERIRIPIENGEIISYNDDGFCQVN